MNIIPIFIGVIFMIGLNEYERYKIRKFYAELDIKREEIRKIYLKKYEALK